ncbi:hypothetical protein H206_01273 [Candidatus Electrothrix aarhusensis]|uniref:Uncharacterized protein n=1 Tax=Candidatus Electrothrix aarhusensis TaxID=1859131 RepID=A0A3S3U8Y3_9BACT|nr:hypothetical protein H206_01273 [Candidatus Electrothrix aarhusensis]
MKNFAQKELKVLPRQVQIFTPTPSTWSTLMYWTGENPFTGQPCFTEQDAQARERQKAVLTGPVHTKGQDKRRGPTRRKKLLQAITEKPFRFDKKSEKLNPVQVVRKGRKKR